MENIDKFEGGEVVHLTPEEQMQEQHDTHEMGIVEINEKVSELREKVLDDRLSDAERTELQEKINGLEEELARRESVTPNIAA